MTSAIGARVLQRSLLAASLIAALLLVVSVSSAGARAAYVADFEPTNTVSVFDTQTNQAIVPPIVVDKGPYGLAITPDGKTAYVANLETTTVSAIATQTNQVLGSPITVDEGPVEVAITPDGKTAYVPNFDAGTVSAINTQTNQAVGGPITVGEGPFGIAITPDGRTVYVASQATESVSMINTQTNQVVGAPIMVGEEPDLLAITPDGKTVYVANSQSGTISTIDTATNLVLGPAITVGEEPVGVAITPDGRRAYVTDFRAGTVVVVDTQTRQVSGPPIPVGEDPVGIAITPDGRAAYVANTSSKTISVIDTQTNQVVGAPITDGGEPSGIAITPDQPPVASFSAPSARPGVPVAFNASSSSDPDGSIARYDWAFGVGAQALNGGPRPRHSFGRPGKYRVTLTLTDNEGCSTSVIFTGQTAYCNGSASASQTQTVKVTYPGVRLNCPKSAKPRGCRFELQAVSKKRNGKAQSAVARAKAKPGRSVLVSLKPKKKFRLKLAAAGKILARETVTINGSQQTVFKKLRVVR